MRITKVVKPFEMTISGKYQSYHFGTTIEAEVVSLETSDLADREISETVQKAEDDLFLLAVSSTFRDIERFSKDDETFKLVVSARDEDLAKFKLLLEKTHPKITKQT